MRKLKIYLAGKMGGLSFETMNNWRVEATNLFKIKSENRIHAVNPVEFYNFEMDRSKFTDKEVMRFDLYQVKTSDLLLVNLEYPDTIGTAIEMYVASEMGIPVIAFGIKDKQVHPWMMLCVDKLCNTLEEAVDYIIDYYLPTHI